MFVRTEQEDRKISRLTSPVSYSRGPSARKPSILLDILRGIHQYLPENNGTASQN